MNPESKVSEPVPTEKGPLAKRIKRHLIGRRQKFFAATAPGLEDLTLSEIETLPGDIEEARAVAGGVSFSGRVPDCYTANLYLRTANRILMRIAEFKATNFRQFEQKIAALPLELYLPGNVLPQLRITTRHCRLYHKDALAAHFKTGMAKRMDALVVDHPVVTDNANHQTAILLFVLGVDDRFTLSIDSSGALLHKRGYKTDVGPAPIRETLAASILMRAGYDGKVPLIDPMCGSGTFALEATMLAQKIAPGEHRDFAFMKWPCFRPRRWAYIKSMARKEQIHIEAMFVLAADRRPGAYAALRKSCERLGLTSAIKVLQRDFEDLKPAEYFKRPGLVVINPPYGKRLGTPKQTTVLFETIGRMLKSHYQGWRLALIAPDKRLARQLPFKLHHQRLQHGGLNLRLLTGLIRG